MDQIRQLLYSQGICSTRLQVRKQKGRCYYCRFYVIGDDLKLFAQSIGFSYASEKQIVLDQYK